MHDNKVRLSRDVLDKASAIAQEWGLKNARAAVEAVFRCYADDYLNGRAPAPAVPKPTADEAHSPPQWLRRSPPSTASPDLPCEALDALDELLGV
ncbi:MAG: hypothetical protein KME20_22900 [Kaiparowitsia implicata GSE-PSE-MK54-09C]|jgi:hypothetical protein|nr:hypothetical protein [Kaiparowitsia implicata GSE-PSE-MK54-09C]